MKFGPVPPKRAPKQDPQKVLRLGEMWQRAVYAHSKWAEPAKEAMRFLEGDQHTEAQIAELRKQGRPHFKFNVISPVVRLVLGYQRNNKVDTRFEPGDDSMATETVADAITKVTKSINKACQMEFVDGEVFLDGLGSGRGYFRTQLDWEKNDFGEAKTSSYDPFSVYPDPDGDTYDLNESCGFVQTARMISLDEIGAGFGDNVVSLLKPFTMGQTPLSPVMSIMINDEFTPVRSYGLREDTSLDYWDHFYSLVGDFVDPLRKTIRVIETEYKVREMRSVVIDLETGDKKVIPETFSPDQIKKILLWGEVNNNPMIIQRRMVERIQWTVMAGDIILYDAPSLYAGFSITPYFPYFRRGRTRGMVEDLVDPQKEKNKSRNARIEIEAKTANGGWEYHESALTPQQKRLLKKFGSTPGFNLEWKGEKKPERIQASQPSMSYEKLERNADEDIRRISGINEAALGEIETVQSGRALEARQRQAVISVQLYMDNFKRSKQLEAARKLDIIQNYYTEQRLYRITGEDGKLSPVMINQLIMDPTSNMKRIINDVTIGKYSAQVSDVPLSASFEAAQFDEMMTLLDKLAPTLGNALPAFSDLIFSMSSIPRKDEWVERLQALFGQGAQGAAPPQAPGAGGIPPDAQPPGSHPQPQASQPGMIPLPGQAQPNSNVQIPASVH